MDLITLDFETYYNKEYSLKKLTTEEYVRDPRFEVLGVAIKVNNGETEWASGTQEQLKTFLQSTTGVSRWYWLTILCLMVLSSLGYLVLNLVLILIQFV